MLLKQSDAKKRRDVEPFESDLLLLDQGPKEAPKNQGMGSLGQVTGTGSAQGSGQDLDSGFELGSEEEELRRRIMELARTVDCRQRALETPPVLVALAVAFVSLGLVPLLSGSLVPIYLVYVTLRWSRRWWCESA
jgi:hypothetical protein